MRRPFAASCRFFEHDADRRSREAIIRAYLIGDVAFIIHRNDFGGIRLDDECRRADGDLLCKVEFECAASDHGRIVLREDTAEDAVELARRDAHARLEVEFLGDIEDLVCARSRQGADRENGDMVDEGELLAGFFDIFRRRLIRLLFDEIPFIEQDGDGASFFDGDGGDFEVLICDAEAGIDDDEDDIGAFDGIERLDDGEFFDALADRGFASDAGRIDEEVLLSVFAFEFCVDRVTRRAGDIGGQKALVPQETVDER